MSKRLIVSSDDEEVLKEALFLGIPTINDMEDVKEAVVSKKEDEEQILSMDLSATTLIRFTDDEIIPLENIIANLRGRTDIIVAVKTLEQARTALETLELGADGVVIETDDPSVLSPLLRLVSGGEGIRMEEATVKEKRLLGLGSRVCIDTCNMMYRNMGMLVGSSSQGMLLIQAEVEENEFVSPRPFRVNAGALSLYTLVPGNKTRYLEELNAGSEVMIVTSDGTTMTSNVARSKIELRPMVLVTAESNGRVAKAILQNAETVKMVSPSGSIAVTDLKEGDRVIAHFEEGGRHFGVLVKEEEVIEK
ncbi:MAG TPA: 3-dehydroquinate synthase II [Candidatus Methanofastidiosa archaeon]|nr:3-dehydroquinate synthase II [Candidatus Methanofastidiosa archaeon]